MFSYFTGGIKNCSPNKKITIERLVKEIRNNNTPTIQAIRALDHTEADFKTKKNSFKATMPYVTPNCTVSYRNDKSIKEFSGYIYFDIDDCENITTDKMKLIEKYTGYLSMLCVSFSGKGLCFFVKIKNEVTDRNFYSIRKYLCETIFHDLNLDPNTSAISNAWYVSYDPDCYYNPSAVIEIQEEYIKEIEEKRKSANTTINISSTDIVKNAPYKYRSIDINEVFRTLKFQTQVEVRNRIFDIEPVNFCEVFMQASYMIPDRKKRSVFGQIIHNLFYINSTVDPDYILNYILWLNDNRTVTAAKRGDVIRWFQYIMKEIETTGEVKPDTRVKYFHCKEKTISPSVRKRLAKRMVNLYKAEKIKYTIGLAKQIIELQKSANITINNSSTDIVMIAPSPVRVTQKDVCQLIKERADRLGVKGLGIRTIKKYWNEEPVDIDEIIEIENARVFVTYISPGEDWDAPSVYELGK